MTAADSVSSASCAACEEPLAGRFCHACGQDSRSRIRPLRDMAAEAFSELSLIDGPVARTIVAMAIRPGRLLEAYRSSASSLYATPLKLFVATTALFLAVLNFGDTTLYQYVWKVDRPGQALTASYDPVDYEVTIDGATSQERWLQPRIEPAIDPEVVATLQAAAVSAPTAEEREAMRYELIANEDEARMSQRLSDWLGNVLWLLTPLYALGLTLLFGRKRLFVEHVIFALWAHAVIFLLAMGLAGLNRLGLNLSAGLLVLPYLGYFTLAARQYYAMTWLQAAWRGVVHLFLYVFVILLPVSFAIYATVMDWEAYIRWLNS